MKSHRIPPIGRRIFYLNYNYFMSLTIKLKEYKITIAKTNV